MSGPMDCSDKINVMTTERALEPVRQLSEIADLTAVTVRTLCGGRRFGVTIREVTSERPGSGRGYRWALREIEEDGTPHDGGLTLGAGEPPSRDPEDAYWSALEALDRAAAR